MAFEIELSAPSANGFSGEWTYKEEFTISFKKKEEFNESILESRILALKRNFCLKYGVELDMITVKILNK